MPPSLRSSISPPLLNFGEQEVIVSLTGAFGFPGIRNNGVPVLVTEYEWKIPKGWTAKTGAISSSGTYKTSDDKISLITDASSGGDVMVRGINDCFNSGDYSLYSYPLIFTRNAAITFVKFPQTVPLGTVETNEFSVKSLVGISFEWEAPRGWSINGGGISYTGGSSVQITTSKCPTNEKVRVRMVKDGEFSEWREFPTKVVLPAIKTPTGQISQYQSSTFSLNMANTDIASVEWFVEGKSVGIVNNKSSHSFSINESGKVKVSAKLTMKGCQSALIPEVEVNVIKAPDPVISGSTTVCTEASYIVENMPPGSTVKWSVANNDIASIDNNGNMRRIKAGKTSINATININNTTITLPPLKIVVLENLSGSMSLGVTRGGPDCFSGGIYFCVNYDGNYDLASLGLTEVEWEFYYDGQYRPNYENVDLLPYCGDQTGAIKRSRISLWVEYISDYKVLTLRVRAKSKCGYWTEWSAGQNFYIYRCRNRANITPFTLFPNPSQDVVNVKFRNEANDNNILTNQTMNEAYSSDIVDIQIWSATSLIRTYKTDQETYQFSVSDLPKGIYFVRLIKDGKIYTEKLVKN